MCQCGRKSIPGRYLKVGAFVPFMHSYSLCQVLNCIDSPLSTWDSQGWMHSSGEDQVLIKSSAFTLLLNSVVVIFPRKFLGIKGTMLAEREECLGRTAQHVSTRLVCSHIYFRLYQKWKRIQTIRMELLGHGTEEISIETYKIWNVSISEQSYRGSQL